jgi:uncharacterized protein
MFDRRTKLRLHQKVSNFFWPSIGWRRSVRYLLHRLGRLPGTPYSIACGFACGAAISFSPFVGLHFILGAIWAWVMRANILASAIGTAVGNPWTFPFIWVWIFQVGHLMGAGDGNMDISDIDFSALFGGITEASLNGDINTVIEISTPVLWPMLLGSLPTIAVVWLIFYFPLKNIVERYQHRRIQRRRKS